MKKTILLAIVFILLSGVIGGFAYFEYVMKPEIIKKAILGQPQPTPSVVTEVAAAEAWRRTVPAIGTLSAVQGIDVAPEAAGIIEKLGFESGQDVEAGTLLVELDDGTEQASLKAAQAQLRNSRVNLRGSANCWIVATPRAAPRWNPPTWPKAAADRQCVRCAWPSLRA